MFRRKKFFLRVRKRQTKEPPFFFVGDGLVRKVKTLWTKKASQWKKKNKNYCKREKLKKLVREFKRYSREKATKIYMYITEVFWLWHGLVISKDSQKTKKKQKKKKVSFFFFQVISFQPCFWRKKEFVWSSGLCFVEPIKAK